MMLALILFSTISFGAQVESNDNMYQLDYRERVSVSFSIPAVGELRVRKSFETRYRPNLKAETITDDEINEVLTEEDVDEI
jgi:hypothetical protein